MLTSKTRNWPALALALCLIASSFACAGRTEHRAPGLVEDGGRPNTEDGANASAAVDATVPPEDASTAAQDESTAPASPDCGPGLSWDTVSNSCTDIDECARDHGGCDDNATCTQSSTAGSKPTCRCNEGYIGDGTRCELSVREFSMRGSHACAIRSDGSLWCWGSNSYGQTGNDTQADAEVLAPVRVGTYSDWEHVSAGNSTTCAISFGRLFCWGRDAYGEAGTNSGLTRAEPQVVSAEWGWSSVSVGEAYACGIQDEKLWCWGTLFDHAGNVRWRSLTPVLIDHQRTWQSVSAGSGYACGLSNGTLFCWGATPPHRGYGAAEDDALLTQPTQVGEENGWTAVTAGDSTACGIRADTLLCWGLGDVLPLNTTDWVPYPTAIGPTGTLWDSVALSTGTAGCALGNRGSARFCWGDRHDEQGYSSWTTHAFDAISVGMSSSCMLEDGALRCWGKNYSGEMAAGSALVFSRHVPTQIGDAHDWSEIATGGGQTCGKRGRELTCFNIEGAYSTYASVVDTGFDFRDLLMESAGRLSARSSGGQCFNGRPDTSIEVLEDSNQCVVGSSYQTNSCMIEASGSARKGHLFCWGLDKSLLGLSGKTATSPAQSGSSESWQTVSIGGSCGCGIDNGALYCWGYDNFGQVGLGDAAIRTTIDHPTRVGSDSDWSVVRMGDLRACGIRGGRLYCWGKGVLGLGDVIAATGGMQSSPRALDSDDTWVDVKLGSSHACALRVDGSLYCWGYNRGGALGLADEPRPDKPINTPTKVTEHVIKFAVGYNDTCAVKNDGTLWCWGSNVDGQLGLPAGSRDLVDVVWP